MSLHRSKRKSFRRTLLSPSQTQKMQSESGPVPLRSNCEKSMRVLGDTRLRIKTRSHGATRRHENSSIASKAVFRSFALEQECEGNGDRFHIYFAFLSDSAHQAGRWN